MTVCTLTWKDVLDCHKTSYGLIHAAAKMALKVGYRYIAWNGRIYGVTQRERGIDAVDTGLLVAALDAQLRPGMVQVSAVRLSALEEVARVARDFAGRNTPTTAREVGDSRRAATLEALDHLAEVEQVRTE